MQKIERRFLIIIILLIITIILVAVFLSLSNKGINRNAYVELINWEAFLNEEVLKINNREKLKINDYIKTYWEESLAIIEWWDWSITRLWWDSEILIESLFVSDKKDKINISFRLLSGKSWSNVVSFIPEESYFLQNFWDTEASVRGTIFNVDLVNRYIYVIENKVLLNTSEWSNILVWENNPINIDTFNFIRLDEFIKNIRDKSFDALNRLLDEELYKKLQEWLVSNMDSFIYYMNLNIDSLTNSEKNTFYKEMLSTYQDLYFINSNNEELYKTKLSLKEKLIELAPEWDKKLLLDSLLKDLEETAKNNYYELIDPILEIFVENSNHITESMIWVINDITNKIPDSLKNSFNDTKNQLFDMVKNLFNSWNK